MLYVSRVVRVVCRALYDVTSLCSNTYVCMDGWWCYVSHLEVAAAGGDLDALVELARAYSGLYLSICPELAVREDAAMAMQYYRAAAAQGDVVCMVQSGMRMELGAPGFDADFKEAVRWYARALDAHTSGEKMGELPIPIYDVAGKVGALLQAGGPGLAADLGRARAAFEFAAEEAMGAMKMKTSMKYQEMAECCE